MWVLLTAGLCSMTSKGLSSDCLVLVSIVKPGLDTSEPSLCSCSEFGNGGVFHTVRWWRMWALP